MREVANLDDLGTFLNAVIDENWCMDELANTRSTGHRAADMREGSQQADVVQKRIAETSSSRRKIEPGIFRGWSRNRLTPGLRFEFGNPLWNHLPRFLKRHRAPLVCGFDALIDRGERCGLNHDFVGRGNLELEVFSTLASVAVVNAFV
jgi:hypothetical protein